MPVRNMLVSACAALMALAPVGDADAQRKAKSKSRTAKPASASVVKPADAGAVAERPKPEPRPILVDVAATGSAYEVGGTLALRVTVDRECHLTLINIESDGRATVLFPNDFEQDNRLAAGHSLSIPGPSAGYRLRLEHPGVDTLLAVCTAEARRPVGIGHDYERQPFTMLGEWDDFLREKDLRERDYQKRIAEENRKRSRRRKDPLPQIVDPPPAAGEPEGRAILLVPVEEPISSSTAQGP